MMSTKGHKKQSKEMVPHQLWDKGTAGTDELSKRHTEEKMFNQSFEKRFHGIVFQAEISPAKAKNFKSTQRKWQVLASGKAENRAH